MKRAIKKAVQAGHRFWMWLIFGPEPTFAEIFGVSEQTYQFMLELNNPIYGANNWEQDLAYLAFDPAI